MKKERGNSENNIDENEEVEKAWGVILCLPQINQKGMRGKQLSRDEE